MKARKNSVSLLPFFYATLEFESRIQFEKCSKITNNNLCISGQDQSDRAWTAFEMSRLTSLHVPSRYSGSSSSVLACTQKQKMSYIQRTRSCLCFQKTGIYLLHSRSLGGYQSAHQMILGHL